MKKLILMISLITGLSVMANAQITKKTPEQRAAHVTKVLQKRLALNEDQANAVNTAFITQATRMDSLKNNPSADKRQNHLTAQSIHSTTRQTIVSVLNDTQKQKFMAWEKMRKERHKEKHEDEGVKS